MTTPLKAVALANVAVAVAILLVGNPAGRDSEQGTDRQIHEMVLVPISPQELQAMSARARTAAEAQKPAARGSGRRAGQAGHFVSRPPLIRIDADRFNGPASDLKLITPLKEFP